jgi:hypothetical protein
MRIDQRRESGLNDHAGICAQFGIALLTPGQAIRRIIPTRVKKDSSAAGKLKRFQ